LLIIVLVMLLTSLFIQMYYGESYQLNIWPFVWPQLVFVLPLFFAISSIAILFESIKWLRGGLGNVVYFFLWIGFITQNIEGMSGIGAILENLETEVATRFPAQQGMSNIGITTSNSVNTFLWDGFTPSSHYLVGMLPLLGISLVGLILAFWCFDRFSNTSTTPIKESSVLASYIEKVATMLDTLFIAATKSFSFTRFFRLELKLMLKGQTNSWFIGLLVFNMCQLFVSQQLLMSAFIPLSLLWCVLVISPLGQLEKQTNTLEIMTYSKRAPLLQNTASLSAGCAVLVLACFGAFTRLIIMTEWLMLIQLCIAIIFITSLAYFCGAFAQTKRMFEVLFPAIWYLGPIQTGLYLDFIGVNSQASWHAGMPYYFLACAATMVTLTMSVKQTR